MSLPQDKDERKLLQRLLSQVSKLAFDLERFNLAEYIDLLNDPRRFLTVNFLGGLARGFGFALGATLLGAFVIYFLQKLVVLNLPLVGDFIAELVRITREQL
ncbi:MAG: DUF5665 domain-containing protein [Dethiobacteria bacterium]|jgi:hypothetical protein|nr:hypothetical protein [Bacillota bacterium]